MNRIALAATLSSLSVASASRPANADALVLVAAAPISRLAPAGPGIAVLHDGAVWLLDDQGRVGARCPDPDLDAGTSRREDGTAREAEEVLRESGFSDEDESPEAEEMLDDEGAPARTPRPKAEPSRASRALDLAGTADSVWIGADDGLWRLEMSSSRCARVGLAGRAVEHVAAGGALVVALSGDTVWRTRDGGLTFQLAAVLPSRPRAAAVGEDGTIFVADDDGAARVGPARAVERALEGRVEALVPCGPVVHALAHDGVYRLNGPDVERVGAPPPARALACAWPGLLAAGAGLWTSADGETWTEDDAGLGRAFTGVALSAGRLWLATNEGLFVPVPGADDALISDGSLPPPARRPGPPPPWAALRPRLAVVLDDWTESQGRAGWRLWVSLTISLDRHALLGLRRLPEVDR